MGEGFRQRIAKIDYKDCTVFRDVAYASERHHVVYVPEQHFYVHHVTRGRPIKGLTTEKKAI